MCVNYTRAPEVPLHDIRAECHAALEWALAQGVEPARLVLAGDSAGGCLAIDAATYARDRQIPVAGLVLVSPWVAHRVRPGGEEDSESYRRFGATDMLSKEFLAGTSALGGGHQGARPWPGRRHCDQPMHHHHWCVWPLLQMSAPSAPRAGLRPSLRRCHRFSHPQGRLPACGECGAIVAAGHIA